jgi:tRNA threonylcarbamoyladenosine biosynthesis protein TsaB
MIDAKRMEVYAQVFDPNMKSMSPARAEILSENSFEELKNETTAFIGNGAGKMVAFEQLFNKANYFPDFVLKAAHMAELAKAKFEQKTGGEYFSI